MLLSIVLIMINCYEGYVGVIDSGIGGLTILKQLQRDYPCCNYVYIADSAYCPYGTKQPQDILQRVNRLIAFLSKCNVQAVVIACNTASVYVNTFRKIYSLPIYDVISSTCERVVSITRNKRVALLSTNATMNSRAYQRQLNAKRIEVVSFACSKFVPFVEANKVDTAKCIIEVNKTLCSLPKYNVDTVILGCTHFPILREKIAPYANGATIVECCTDFLPTDIGNQHGKTVYLTTGEAKQANNASKWFGQADFVHINL